MALVETLVAQGHAYTLDGDVAFWVPSFPEYGKLSKRDFDSQLAGARVEEDTRKRDPRDFSLWKAAKPGEPSWDSPWGPGRPGWHIECSAMSRKYLGDSFDIHGGGSDLIFPHHENEIAQSEAACKCPFASYWMHNGMLNILAAETGEAEKMSKSLGNVLSLSEAIKRTGGPALRYYYAAAHYGSDLAFGEGRVGAGAAGAGAATDREPDVGPTAGGAHEGGRGGFGGLVRGAPGGGGGFRGGDGRRFQYPAGAGLAARAGGGAEPGIGQRVGQLRGVRNGPGRPGQRREICCRTSPACWAWS